MKKSLKSLTSNKGGWYIAIVILGILFFLTACNEGAVNSNEKNDGAKVSSQEDQKDQKEQEDIPEIDYRNMKAELTVYSDLYPGEWEEIFAPHVQAQFPNYTFNFITWSGDTGVSPDELVAGGTKVDIMIGRARHLVEEWQAVNMHTPMDPWMEKHGISKDDFEPQYFDAVTIDGKIHAIPLWNDGFVTFYNKEVFDRFGIDHPTDGMSWEEATALADEITRNDNGKQYIGQWYSPPHILRVNQKSLPFVDPETMKPVIDSPGWHEWVEELFHKPMQHIGLQEYAQKEYFGYDHFRHYDEVGMFTFQTVWIRNHRSQLTGLNDWDIVAVPTFDGDGIGVQPYGQYIALSSVSNAPDAAMQVIKYLTGEEYQMQASRAGFITPLKSEAIREQYMKENGLEDKNLGAIFYNELAQPHQITPYDEIVINTMHQEVLTDVVRGHSDVNSALRKGLDIAEKAIQDELLRRSN